MIEVADAGEGAAPRRARGAAPDWRPWRALALLAMVPVAGVILLGTLGPPMIAQLATERLVGLVLAIGWDAGYTGVQTAANVAMFVPFGALLAMGTRPSRWPAAILAAPALSLGIEQLQHWVPGRVTDALDVVTNVTGGVLGFLAGGVVVGVIAVLSALVGLVGARSR